MSQVLHVQSGVFPDAFDDMQLINVADKPEMAYLRRVNAGLVTAFGNVALFGSPPSHACQRWRVR